MYKLPRSCRKRRKRSDRPDAKLNFLQEPWYSWNKRCSKTVPYSPRRTQIRTARVTPNHKRVYHPLWWRHLHQFDIYPSLLARSLLKTKL